MKQFVGALIFNRKGRVLSQLRDDKKGILFPNVWTSTPGGHLMKGEEPVRALHREIYEEFRLRLHRVRFLKKLVRKRHDQSRGVYFLFTGRCGTHPDPPVCLEGQRAEFLEPEEALRLKQHPVSRRVLVEYLGKRGAGSVGRGKTRKGPGKN